MSIEGFENETGIWDRKYHSDHRCCRKVERLVVRRSCAELSLLIEACSWSSERRHSHTVPTTPKMMFSGQNIKAVIHLGLVHNPRANDDDYRFNVLGTQKLLDLTSKYEVDKFVMLSSANIYGPHPDNSLFLKEDDPLLGAQSFPGIRDLVAVDRIVQSFLSTTER